ncbi:hypothetical protein [Kitasatospora fiedleri]|uniref:hypothetical protein n=1 Tax=Kitasatospora fiedleri TaxID=2991545 RepID=UPI00249AE2C2|nr:hypothetical protein [Kitasatospora fiedleri]
MGTENGRLMVKAPKQGRGKFRVYTGRTVLDWARPGGNTPFVLPPGPHRVQVRRGLDRSNTVTVDVPAAGRVQVEVHGTWAGPALLPAGAAALLLTSRLGFDGSPWSLLAWLPLLLVPLLPGTGLRLRVVEP